MYCYRVKTQFLQSFITPNTGGGGGGGGRERERERESWSKDFSFNLLVCFGLFWFVLNAVYIKLT